MNYSDALKAGRVISGGRAMPNPYKLSGGVPDFGRTEEKSRSGRSWGFIRNPEPPVKAVRETDSEALEEIISEEAVIDEPIALVQEVAEEQVVAESIEAVSGIESVEDEEPCDLPLLSVACRNGTNAHRRTDSFFRRLMKRFGRQQSDVVSQDEFDFTEVRVERNDLFDADLQLIQVPRNSMGGTVEESGSVAVSSNGSSWGGLVRRVFGGETKLNQK